MEAAATPFPSEETTPPVTKMYFGAERKGLDFLRKESAYPTLWSQWRRVSNHDFNFYFEAIWRVDGAFTVWRRFESTERLLERAFAQNFFDFLDVRGNIDAHAVVIRFNYADVKTIL
jgi:hypothetical protein